MVTSVLALQASRMEMKTNIEEFLPDMEEVRVFQNLSSQETEPLQMAFLADNALSRDVLLSMAYFEGDLMENESLRPYLKDPEDPRNSTYSLAYMVALTASLASYSLQLNESLTSALETVESANITLLPELSKRSLNIAENLTILAREVGYVPIFNATAFGANLTADEDLLLAIFDPGIDPELVAEATLVFLPPNATGNLSVDLKIALEFYESLNESDPGRAVPLVRAYVLLLESIMAGSELANESLQEMLHSTYSIEERVSEAEGLVENGSYEGAIEVLEEASSRIQALLATIPYELYVTVNESAPVLGSGLEDGTASYGDLVSVRQALSILERVGPEKDSYLAGLAYDSLDEYLYHRDAGFLASQVLNVTGTSFGARLREHDLFTSELEMLNNLIFVLENMPAMAQAYLRASQEQLETIAGMLLQYGQEVREFYNLTHSEAYVWYLSVYRGLLDILNRPDILAFKEAVLKIQKALPEYNVSVNASGTVSFLGILQGNYSRRAKRALISVVHEALLLPKGDLGMDHLPPRESEPRFSLSLAEEREILEKEDYLRLLKVASDGGPPGLGTIAERLSERASELLPLVDDAVKRLNRSIRLLEDAGLEGTDIWNSYRSAYNGLKGLRSAVRDAVAAPEGVSEFSRVLREMYGRVTLMASKDFDGSRASSGLVIVYLKQPEEDEREIEFYAALERQIMEMAKTRWSDVQGFAFAMMYSEMNDSLIRTRERLIPIAFLVVLLIIVWIMRRPFDVLVSLIGIGMAIVWAYGIGALLGFSMNQIVVTVAVILVGLTIDYAIHVTTRYAEEYAASGSPVDAGRRTVEHLGLALFLSMFTTAVAFLSNVSSPIPPVRQFGVMLAVGILSAFIIFVTFGISTRILYDRRGRRPKMEHVAGVGEALGRISAAAYRRPLVVFSVAILLTGFMAYQLTWLHMSFDLTKFLPQDAPSTMAYNFFLDSFRGGIESTVYVYIQGDIDDPSFLKAEKGLEEELSRSSYVSEISYGPWKMLHDEYGRNETFRKLVDERDLDGDGVPDVDLGTIWSWLRNATGDYDRVFAVPGGAVLGFKPSSEAWRDKEGFVDYLYRVTSGRPVFERAVPTGGIILDIVISRSILTSQIRSIVITLGLAIALLLGVFSYLNRSPMFGIITAVPVSLATIWLLGTINVLGQDLNVLTVTEASLIFGVGIDYAVHVAVRFVEERGRGKDIEGSVRDSIKSTGAAILLAALTTVGGFGTLILSDMPHIRTFGILSSLGIAYSLFLTVVVFPALVSMWAPAREGAG